MSCQRFNETLQQTWERMGASAGPRLLGGAHAEEIWRKTVNNQNGNPSSR